MGLINKILKNKPDTSDKKEDDVKVAKKDSNKKESDKKVKTAKVSKVKLGLQSISDKVLTGPLITEKAAIAESFNKYSFKVATWSTKSQIKKAVLEIYGVMPTRVSIVNVDSKQVSFRQHGGRKSSYKKAVVTLPKGKTIDIHKGV